MASISIHKRIATLEARAFPVQHRKVRLFSIEGPSGLPDGAAVAFLRACGHDIHDKDHNIIRVFVGAENGNSFYLPLRDLTAQHAR